MDGHSLRPVAASRMRSAAAAAVPAVLRTEGLAGVFGCGLVGALFLASSIARPRSSVSAADSAARSTGQTAASSNAMWVRAALMTSFLPVDYRMGLPPVTAIRAPET